EPCILIVLPPNVPPALMNHPLVPVQHFPGLPHNLIECHEVSCAWHAHHPQPPQLFGPQFPPFNPVPPLHPPFTPAPPLLLPFQPSPASSTAYGGS
ncbi:hypothetical protein PAXRUDRAFT_136308, partial [Paxillus rubicundulus Ve08.2h10]